MAIDKIIIDLSNSSLTKKNLEILPHINCTLTDPPIQSVQDNKYAYRDRLILGIVMYRSTPERFSPVMAKDSTRLDTWRYLHLVQPTESDMLARNNDLDEQILGNRKDIRKIYARKKLL